MAVKPRPSPSGRVLTILALLAVVGMISVGTFAWRRPGKSAVVSGWRNPAGPRYANEKTCKGCHKEIVASFREHPMGRSLFTIDEAKDAGPEPASFDYGRLHYESLRKDGQLVHRETMRDESGKVVGQVEEVVRYLLGSGTRGYSYIIERGDGRLLQSPLSWYTQGQRWDLAPGYHEGNQHFERPVLPECLFCHTDRVEEVPGSLNRFRTETVGHAIGCQRCHGPSEQHVKLVGSTDDEGVPTVINPALLEPALRDAVCEQCHLQGETRVIRAGRSLSEYRPGQSLDEVLSVYVRPGSGRLRNRSIGHSEQMTASRCYQASEGRMGCISCHDPHFKPPEAERVAYYRDRCLNCHQDRGCSLPQPERDERSNDCVACHMPRSQLMDIAHTASTLHHIPRSLEQLDEEPPPPEDERELVRYHEERLSARDHAETRRDLGIALATRGRTVGDRTRVPELAGEAEALLKESLRNRPDDPDAWEALSGAYGLLGRPASALDALDSGLKYDPNRERSLILAVSLAGNLGRFDKAHQYVERLLELNPTRASHHALLAVLLSREGKRDQAEAAANEALRLDPAHEEARKVLIQNAVAKGLLDRAAEQARILDLYRNNRP